MKDILSIDKINIQREGNQSIAFPSSWGVIKLDGHKYYRRISGLGIKAVDYIAVDAEWGLYLIELKDYSRHNTHLDPIALNLQLAQKKEGSIKVIKVINEALKRQLYYRIIFIRCKWYRLCPDEWLILYHAQKMIAQNKVYMLADICTI